MKRLQMDITKEGRKTRDGKADQVRVRNRNF
jgi:hypothetical protein